VAFPRPPEVLPVTKEQVAEESKKVDPELDQAYGKVPLLETFYLGIEGWR
jgi:hypothetical protein